MWLWILIRILSKSLSLVRERMKKLDEFNIAYYFYRKPEIEKKFMEKFSNLNKAHEIINNFQEYMKKYPTKIEILKT